jgi:hypothetical protein
MRARAAVGCVAIVCCIGAGSAAAAAPRDTPAHMRAIVRAWSNRLNSGDNKALARLFSAPAIVIQGGVGYKLANAAQVALYFQGLPCSGRVVSISVKGHIATAVFVLGSERPGMRCDAPGQKAAAEFEIVKGKIRLWQQVPVPVDPKGA